MKKTELSKDGYLSLESILQSHVESLIKMKDEYPFFAFVIGSVMIELLGSCINPASGVHISGKSEEDFNYAINTLDAFKDYRSVPFNLYTAARCSLAHSLLVGKDIILTTDDGNLNKKTIGLDSFVESIRLAWDTVKKDEVAKKRLVKKEMIISEASSGGTESYLVKEIKNTFNR